MGYGQRTGRGCRVVLAGTAALVLAVAGCTGQDSNEQPEPVPSPEPTGPEPPPARGPGFHELTLDWNGKEHAYLLDAPDGYDPAEPTPLVIVLHGAPSSAAGIRDLSDMTEFSQQHDVLVAYPQGEANRWRRSSDTDRVDDTGYLTALVDELVAEWNVAPGEVYAAGFSNGATMAYRLAVEAADVFAAVAPISGVFAFPPDSIEPAEPVSLVGFVGLDDGDVVDSGSLDLWRDQLDCEPAEPTVVDEDERVTRIDATCRDGSEVIEYQLEGVGHVWPKRDMHGLDASQAMWEVFSAHAR